MQLYKNPFYLYVITFTIVIVVYQLGWSTLYPNLSIALFLFFIITCIISLFLGAVVDKYSTIQYSKPKSNSGIKRTIFAIYLLLILEFIYNKGIPLLLVFSNSAYEYTEFGIPTLHPILATFTSFYTVYVFHVLISYKKKRYLIYLFILLLFPILIYNRGMLLISLLSCLIVFLMSIKRIKLKAFAYIALLAVVLLYFFGVLGNYRLVKSSSNDYFLKSAKATDKFVNSKIPKEYLWSYIYISSPLANLQNNINENSPEKIRVKDFMATELLPDFISKRIVKIIHAEQAEIVQIASFLTVGTVFARSYSLLGWPGIYLMYLLLAAFIFLYVILLKKSNKYYVTGISLLCTFVIFNAFSNMVYFSGVSFQLVYPILLGLFTIRIRKKRLTIQ